MKDSRQWLVFACLMICLTLACGTKEEPATPTTSAPAAHLFNPAKGTAAIAGKVLLDGPVPASAQIKMNADPVCASLHKEPVTSEELVVIEGSLVNVFVYVKEGLEKYAFSTPIEPVTLSQHGCRYEPHVGGIMVNQDMRILNNDPTVHNVHCMAEKNPQFNLGQPIQGSESVRKFKNPEVMVKFRCDVHKWMNSYFGVLPHPYYGVTGKDGSFSLKGLPPGEYVIEAWHERFGSQTQKVIVGDQETKGLTFRFKGRSS